MSGTTTSDAEVPPPRGAWMALAALLAAQAMGNMDNSIVNVASKTIREDLAASGGSLQAILAGYTLVFGILVVTGARLGDDKGYRQMFLTGLAGFVLASLLCGLAPNGGALALARGVQGGMGALMVPQVLSSIQTMFCGRHLARAISYYSMILALGVAAGQILGGLIVGANLFGYSWRMAFLLNVPIGIAVWLLARAYLPAADPKPRTAGPGRRAGPRCVDGAARPAFDVRPRPGLAGELTTAEAGRRNKVSETPIAKWKQQVPGGRSAGSGRGRVGLVTVAPVVDGVEPVAAKYAAEWPGWGDRKIWGLMRADGHSVSVSSVECAMRHRGLLQCSRSTTRVRVANPRRLARPRSPIRPPAPARCGS